MKTIEETEGRQMTFTHPDLDEINAAVKASCTHPKGVFEIVHFEGPPEDVGGLIMGDLWGWSFVPDDPKPENFIGFDSGYGSAERALAALKEYVGYPVD